jgi:hypothetical protein
MKKKTFIDLSLKRLRGFTYDRLMQESEKETSDPVSEIKIQGRCKTKVMETKE